MRGHEPCPHCGQRMMYMRAGARLPPLKARIYDAIVRAGPDGISAADIIESLRLDVGQNGIRAHIWQINQILQRFSSSERIVSRNLAYKIIGANRDLAKRVAGIKAGKIKEGPAMLARIMSGRAK